MAQWTSETITFIISTIILGAISASLFEWVIKPLSLRVYTYTTGKTSQISKRISDKSFRDAAALGSDVAILHCVVTILILILAGTMAISVAVIVTNFDLISPETARSYRDHRATRILTGTFSFFSSMHVFYIIFSRIQRCMSIIAIRNSFDRTIKFVGPCISEKEERILWHEFSKMRSTEDAKNINRSIINICEREGVKIPWEKELII